ncbi:roadblock/LC7 domain-containing protein [Anaeromyxobacter paludicola]|uniref:Dynein regulation protein LC7 n=1 Tax=Anaeromyxobacter paludicola TaxID=2918171 RepID=A0ABM7XEW9_9BACT|nr:roadblock/LC7 domain-containing protein [Anaeromyxobacter paludicola]BDG10425.1 dynein regulation protein LC7 [Anaeromyxobacter paludicola]
MNSGLVMYDEEFRAITAVCEHLCRDANANVVFLVDKNGQLITSSGHAKGELDTTSLASLTAGNVAAMGGLAKLIGEREFPTQFHEGERESLHMSIVAGRVVLVVVFDARSSLGLVRLRVKKASEEIGRVLEKVAKRQASTAAQSPFAEITDEDIDNLFSDRS